MKVSDLQRKPPHILMYGPPGSWKTSTALTAGPGTLVLDLDNGLTSALTLDDEFKQDRLAVDVEQFLEDDLSRPKAFLECKKFVKKLAGKKPEDLPSCVVLDSLTALSDVAINHVMKNNGKSLDDAPEIQHWGAISREIMFVMKHLYSLRVPVILIAHDMMNQINEDTTVIEIAVSGKKVPREVQQCFDDIWYMKMKPIGQNKYDCRIQTVKDNILTARSRNGLKTGTSASLGMKKLFAEMGYDFKPRTEEVDTSTGEVKS